MSQRITNKILANFVKSDVGLKVVPPIGTYFIKLFRYSYICCGIANRQFIENFP